VHRECCFISHIKTKNNFPTFPPGKLLLMRFWTLFHELIFHDSGSILLSSLFLENRVKRCKIIPAFAFSQSALTCMQLKKALENYHIIIIINAPNVTIWFHSTNVRPSWASRIGLEALCPSHIHYTPPQLRLLSYYQFRLEVLGLGDDVF